MILLLQVTQPALLTPSLHSRKPPAEKIKHRDVNNKDQIEQGQSPPMLLRYRRKRGLRIPRRMDTPFSQKHDDESTDVNKWNVHQVVEQRYATECRQHLSNPT